MTGSGPAATRFRIPKAAFERYLHTGLVVIPPEDVEVKFNPWHDPETGRFTFGNGRTWGGGGFTGGGGGGNYFGGGGASGSWDAPTKPQTRAPTPATAKRPGAVQTPLATALAFGASEQAWHSITSSGYVYRIDDAERTRQVTGTLRLNPDQTRSRSSQTGAGGSDRLPTDDGGHYIARRFDGPRGDFNHFAQDASFNRSGYKALENKWATATKAGDSVWVSIVPEYSGSSRRPSSIRVQYTVKGIQARQTFTNSSERKIRGKR